MRERENISFTWYYTTQHSSEHLDWSHNNTQKTETHRHLWNKSWVSLNGEVKQMQDTSKGLFPHSQVLWMMSFWINMKEYINLTYFHFASIRSLLFLHVWLLTSNKKDQSQSYCCGMNLTKCDLAHDSVRPNLYL